MRNTILEISLVVALATGLCVCFGDCPPLSITKSNSNVILTWPQTTGNWLLIETPGLDYYYSSNGVVYGEAYRRTIIPNSNYSTNGTNISVTLPIVATNKFYMLRTNNPPPPPL